MNDLCLQDPVVLSGFIARPGGPPALQLMDVLRAEVRARGAAEAVASAYVAACLQFLRFYKPRPAEQLREPEILAFLTHWVGPSNKTAPIVSV